ncbi:hypothetical protein Tco_1129668 [Tanacetum coccineum]
MSTQQDIYAADFENRPLMLNKENYVPWSSHLLCYAKIRPNGKLIYNSIMNGPYVRRMIPEPGDPARTVPIPETFHEQTNDEPTEAEIKKMEADDQAIQTILLGLPEDIYATIDSCETAQEIWLRVQQMMKGSDIGIQEKKAKLFNEWERFTSNDGESIASYYHSFSKLMNDFKRNKHFPEKIASNLKFLNNLQPKWSRHVTIVHQTKDLHTVDYTQLYDFLKYNQKEVDELRAERLAKTQDPLALMANSNNSFKYSMFHPDLPSSSTYIQQPGDPARTVLVLEMFHEQTNDEPTEAEIKQMEAVDQEIQTILLGLPEDIYATVDSCETAQEIWLRVQQMMKGSDIGIQEKKAKFFNEWERFTSNDGESIASYYHSFSKRMNDFKRNKHFPEKIAINLKFLNNLQPEWSRHVTIVHQKKDLHTVDYTQLYDFLKYNQKEVDELRAERLAITQDPLAFMAN